MSGWRHQMMRDVWGKAQDALVALARPDNKGEPRVYYGGARSGRAGGPQVKTGLLQQTFPEHYLDFNLVYLLSGSLHLSPESLHRLKMRNTPIVMNQNGVFFPAWYPDGWQAQNEKLARALYASDHVFYQSAFCKRMADQFLGVKAKSSEILYNAVDTKIFTPAPHSTGHGPLRLLLTGKIGASTASRLISTIQGVDAARRGGIDAVLDIYGLIDPVVLERAVLVIEELNLRDSIFFKGPYNRLQAVDIYRSADVYVMNKPNDSCPNTVLEAMSCGLPVLYAASGGVPELVGDKAGVGMEIVEDFTHEITPSPLQFAESLQKLLLDRETFSHNARLRACAHFDLEHWLQRHRQIFTDLLRK